jgi:hypothetical protein
MLTGTKNFTRAEALRASGGFIPVEYENNAQQTLQWLQAARDYLGKPIIITSLYRSPKRNAATEGSADDSQHLKAEGADFVVQGMTNHEAAAKLMQAEKEGRLPPYHQLITYNKTNHLHYGRGTDRQKLVNTGSGYVVMTLAYLKKAKPVSIGILLMIVAAGVFFFPSHFTA